MNLGSLRTRPAALALLATLLLLLVAGGARLGARAGTGPAVPSVGVDTVFSSPAGNLPAGPRPNGTAVLPDGRLLTPVGQQTQVELQPLNGVLSADGRRLYVSSEGIDDDPGIAGNQRFVTVIDTATGAKTLVRDDALHFGMAESRDGRTLFVSEGQTGSVGVFSRTPPANDPGAPGAYAKVATIVLNPSQPTDYPWGLALSPDGKLLYVAGFESNTLSVVDTASRTVISRVATGNYPYSVVVSADGQHVYVSNWGLYNKDAGPLAGLTGLSPIGVPPLTIGGYNTTASSSVWGYNVTPSGVQVDTKTRIGLPINGADVVGGSLPSGLALSPDGSRLAVTSSNDDLVQVLDTNRRVSGLLSSSLQKTTIDLHEILGGPTGAQPDAVSWIDGSNRLLVAEAGRNSVAVVDATQLAPDETELPSSNEYTGSNRLAVLGRMPTGWYPTAVVPSPDENHLYIVNDEGLGSGPNAGPTTGKVTQTSGAQYIPNTLFGTVEDVQLPWALSTLTTLSQLSDRDNGLTQAPSGTDTVAGDGSVVPTSFGSGPSGKIKHVFLIIKENRPYDQVFGDLAGGERAQVLTTFGQSITPNSHALAARFSVGDNFYANSETSVDGHYSVDTGQINQFVLETTPSSYAGKFPHDTFQTQPENIPLPGFIWDNAGVHGVRTRVYGEGTYVVGILPQQLGKGVDVTPRGTLAPGIKALNVSYDPLYASQVDLQDTSIPGVPGSVAGPVHQAINALYPYNDEGRASEFARDISTLDAAGLMPQLNVMILFDDHTAGYLPGASSPEDYVAENDHALGEVIQSISNSSVWPSSAVFVAEDDTQGGVDHVDAHRSFGMVISPWAKPGFDHAHTSFSSMTKTIDLLLGLPPTSTEEMTASSMASNFITGDGQANDAPYSALPNTTFPVINPLPSFAGNSLSSQAAALALQIPPGIDQGGALAPLDEMIGRQGALLSGDPNVKPEPPVVEHTLTTGSPQPAPEPVSQGGPWWGSPPGRQDS